VPVLVAEQERLLGWAALSPVSDRCTYSGAAKVSICVAAEARDQCLGQRLLASLACAAEDIGLWTLQVGILDDNAASFAVHRAAGFLVVGRRERLGQLMCAGMTCCCSNAAAPSSAPDPPAPGGAPGRFGSPSRSSTSHGHGRAAQGDVVHERIEKGQFAGRPMSRIPATVEW